MLKSGGGHLEQVPLVPPALPEGLVTSLAPPLKSAAERATGQTRAKWVQKKKTHKKNRPQQSFTLPFSLPDVHPSFGAGVPEGDFLPPLLPHCTPTPQLVSSAQWGH